MKELGDDEGRLSLDMLIGLSIFLFAFIFLGQFLPSVFADARSEISLFAEAYKVSVLLTEDPGRWINLRNTSEKGFHWETNWYEKNVSFRPGLAKVGRAGFISLHKLIELRNATIHYGGSYANDTWIRDIFGLDTPTSSYHVNISLLIPFSTSYNHYYSTDNNGQRVLTIGPPIPNKRVSRYERLVNLPVHSGFIQNYANLPNNVNYRINSTFPLGGALLIVIDTSNIHAQCWVEVRVNLTNTTSLNSTYEIVYELGDKVGNTCDITNLTGIYPLTRELNEGYEETYENFIETFNELPNNQSIVVRIKNLNCTLALSNVGEIVGDLSSNEARIVSKLVVTVWEG
jgi:hypothetical protein